MVSVLLLHRKSNSVKNLHHGNCIIICTSGSMFHSVEKQNLLQLLQFLQLIHKTVYYFWLIYFNSNPSGVILCQEIRKSCSLYIYIYNFCSYFLRGFFYFAHNYMILNIPIYLWYNGYHCRKWTWWPKFNLAQVCLHFIYH